MTELNAQLRDKDTNADNLRAAGSIPAVFYGPKEETTSIALNTHEFLRVWDEAGGSAIVDLKGAGDDKEVLIHDVDWHPVKGTPQHVDLYCIERGKKLTVTVPLSYVGEAPVEKEGGIVVKVMHELEIEVKPRDIPQEIEVDVSKLTELNSSITIADLNLPETIEPTAELGDTVAAVTQAKEEPVEEEERDISDVEIEGESKDDEDGESAQDSSDEEN